MNRQRSLSSGTLCLPVQVGAGWCRSVDKVYKVDNLTNPRQRHPAGFGAIKYTSRFVDQPCLALFDRGGLPSKLRVKALGALDKLEAAVDWLDERKAALA